MTRGGKRPGAGRKPALTFKQQMLLGALCDQYQASFRLNAAEAEYERIPVVKALAEARALLKGKDQKAQARIIRSEVRPLIRVVKQRSVRVKRGKTRAEIIRWASDLGRLRFGMVGATPRRVEASWKLVRRLMADGRLISARLSESGEG